MCQFFDITLGQLLEDNVDKYPDHEALVYSDRNLRYTFLNLMNGLIMWLRVPGHWTWKRRSYCHLGYQRT